jgi:hypothetical protein
MVNEPHAFEDDMDIVETVENGETLFSAFADRYLVTKSVNLLPLEDDQRLELVHHALAVDDTHGAPH